MRIAVVDLGTNTFNLFIADLEPGEKPSSVFKSRIPVRLGDKINDRIISPEAFERGLKAITEFNEAIVKYKVENKLAFGTSAIRSADNGLEFCHKFKSITGFEVNVIDGDAEADYIYKGVREAVDIGNEPVLILDIGGGSNEFIIADKETIYWKQSYNLGIARLLQLFAPTDPITGEEETKIRAYLNDELKSLFDAVKEHPVCELIGASGSFETFAELSTGDAFTWEERTEYVFSEGEYEEVSHLLRNSTREERLEMEGMIEMRADMIVVASILVDVVIENCGIRKIRVSDYALKEGAIFSILKN